MNKIKYSTLIYAEEREREIERGRTGEEMRDQKEGEGENRDDEGKRKKIKKIKR